jgi:hypothetical protein
MNQFINELPKFNPPMVFMKHKHLFTNFSVKKIEHIIEWCKKEYWDSLAYWSKQGNYKNVRFEAEEFSTIRLMAMLTVFDEIILFFKYFPYVWDGLSKPSRKFLASAYELRGMLNQ